MESGLGQTRARGVPQHLILRFWPIQARPTNFPRISFFWKETESKISVVFLFSLGGERGGGGGRVMRVCVMESTIFCLGWTKGHPTEKKCSETMTAKMTIMGDDEQNGHIPVLPDGFVG